MTAYIYSQVTMDNCSLITNTAGNDGGAVRADENSHVSLGNCLLIQNTAWRCGGAVSAYDGILHRLLTLDYVYE